MGLLLKRQQLPIIAITVATLWLAIAPITAVAQSLKDADRLDQQATQLKQQRRYNDAVEIARKALVIREKVLGLRHPAVATSLNNLAKLYRDQGRYADAEPLYKRSLAINEKALGPGHPAVATSLNNLAELYRAQGIGTGVNSAEGRCVLDLRRRIGTAMAHMAA